MRTQFIAVAFVTASLSMTAFAEQPVQAGETLESLSKAKVTTTVNGQPGSLEELVNSGKVQLISAQSNPVQTQPLNSQDVQAVTPHQSEMAVYKKIVMPCVFMILMSCIQVFQKHRFG